MRRLTNAALAELDARFSALYEGIGRPSIPPERLLRAVLLQLLYSIRSERQLVERLEFDMLFRWFVGLTIDEKVFDASTFSKNRDRLLTYAIAQEFLSSLLGLPEVKGLLSAEHFSVDGTLLKAWASMKSFRPKSLSSGEDPRTGSGEPPSPGRNGEADFRNTKRSNATQPRQRTRTRAFTARAPGGADKGYDAEAFVEGLKARRIEPHIAINGTVSKHGNARKTAVPSEVAASLRYAISSAAAQADRGRLRLDEDGRRSHAGEGARPRQGARRLRLRHGRLQHRPPAQAPGPEGRSASGDMKTPRTRTQSQAKTSKMSRIHPQKIAPASLIAQTH
jgi:transposase